MTTQTSTYSRLLAVIAAILVVAALKIGRPVILPLLIAVFLIVVAWPMQVRLEARLPRWIAFIATLLVILLSWGVIGSAFLYSAERVAERAPQLEERLAVLARAVSEWGRRHYLPTPDAAGGLVNIADRVPALVERAISSANSVIGLLGLVVMYLVLGLLEVRDFERKVVWRLRERLGTAVLETAETIAGRVRRFLVALAITCAMSAIPTALFLWAMGLELWPTWGILTFVLNFIPTIGPAVAVIPPTLYALLQFEGFGRPLAVFLGVSAIQFFVGNFLDPKIHGRALALSPLVVAFAVVFWGWMWGAFGALLAAPLTVAMVIVSQQFKSTRWVAALLTGVRDSEREESG
ncbi:MAG TPA: AI-2E family transporter [Gemmatimonadaceae bacterium]|nr:AI-2E family transporter [Gemmatimonadaceae bacterium]